MQGEFDDKQVRILLNAEIRYCSDEEINPYTLLCDNRIMFLKQNFFQHGNIRY